MLYIATLFWTPSERSYKFSRDYTAEWVEKLYRGFNRNLTVPFKFVVFTDKLREYNGRIEQRLLKRRPITYGSVMEAYSLGEPSIIVGLDTLIVGNIDHWARYALDSTSHNVLVPRDPNKPSVWCNGVQIVPRDFRHFFSAWDGQNDMAFINAASRIGDIDKVFPGEAISYKCQYKKDGLGDARVVYFHGRPKMHQIQEPELLCHWK